MSKKMLVVGDGNSVFVRDFIANFVDKNVTVDLISLTFADPLPKVRMQIQLDVSKYILKFQWLRRLFLVIFGMHNLISKSDDGYDSVVVHYVSLVLVPYLLFLRKKSKNFVVVVWGSDFYRSTPWQDYLRKFIYKSANNIVFTNPKTLEDFSIKYKQIISPRKHVARFGLPVLDEINSIRRSPHNSRVELHNFFNFPEKRIVLAGYSSNPSHNQLSIIESLSKLDSFTKAQIHLVFPLGYGATSIKDKIVKKLREKNITSYTLLTKFYGPSDIAKLRCITDILINIQKSDQFSGSMQETLYAGGYVIAGDWLPYKQLVQLTSKITLISHADDVGQAVKEILLTTIEDTHSASTPICDYIKSVSSWEVNLPVWDRILFR